LLSFASLIDDSKRKDVGRGRPVAAASPVVLPQPGASGSVRAPRGEPLPRLPARLADRPLSAAHRSCAIFCPSRFPLRHVRRGATEQIVDQ
jgi:hypothetical protein